MDEDARFPNRKRKNWDEPGLGDKLPDAELQEFYKGSAEAGPLPQGGYRIVGPAPEDPGGQPAEANLNDLSSASAPVADQNLISVSAAAEAPKPAADPPLPPPSKEARVGWMRRIAQSPTMIMISAVVGLGILVGIVLAVASHLMSNPNGRYDLGPVTSSATGLEGRLFIQWDKKLEYRLALKPSDPDQQAGFALAVAHPQRPLSIAIHLLDSGGFVLCSRDVVLKYDARNAAAPARSAPDSPAGNTDSGKTSSGQPAPGVDSAQLDAQEPAREHGKDIFQNQLGPDGQIAAINSQGDLPCSADAYEKATNWSFSPNFPSLAEQDEWLDRQKEMEAGAERPSQAEVATRRRTAAKAAAKLLPFSIEGDDAIVDFDTSQGIIQTRGRKTFFVGKAAATGADSRWQDYPVPVHYRCDRSSNCTLMDAGVGVLRARLGR